MGYEGHEGYKTKRSACQRAREGACLESEREFLVIIIQSMRLAHHLSLLGIGQMYKDGGKRVDAISGGRCRVDGADGEKRKRRLPERLSLEATSMASCWSLNVPTMYGTRLASFKPTCSTWPRRVMPRERDGTGGVWGVVVEVTG